MPNSELILVVEDHADTSAALYRILTEHGYSVVTADDGQEALDLLARGTRPRLILIDLLLPHVSGDELLKYLHSERDLREIPTIVITAAPRHHISVVADAVFSKPLDFIKLRDKIDALLTP